MKRRITTLTGFTIGGTDGEIGNVEDFYFDDETWTIRYLVVETGSWLSGRKVLLSTKAIVKTDWAQETFDVDLNMEQIKNSPSIDTKKPVSRQHESELYNYYPWGNYYWGGSTGLIGMNMSYPLATNQVTEAEKIASTENNSDADPHLRSCSAVTGYNIKAIDGEIGDVEDFIVNDTTWLIDFLLVNTGNWFPGKKVLIAPKMIKEISWQKSLFIVNATEEQVKYSPEYKPGDEVTESFEANLQNFYGKFISHKK